MNFDSLFEVVAREAVQNGVISTSTIQRSYDIGFNRAGRIMMQLEQAGIVGRQQGVKPREIFFQDMPSLEKRLTDIRNEGSCERTMGAITPEEQERFLKDREDQEKREIAERIKEKYRKQQLEKIVRQELIDSGELFGEQPKRPPIPREIVDAVYKRDGGRCAYCGSTQNLQLDHIIPFSKGGATILENLQLLCQKCNIEKSNKIG